MNCPSNWSSPPACRPGRGERCVGLLAGRPRALAGVVERQAPSRAVGQAGPRRAEAPRDGWTWRETLEEGKWRELAPEPVDIPATYSLMNGVWFRVRQGVRGLLVHTGGEPVVFPICEPATRYYRVMTRAEWLPTLIGEVI